MFLGRHLVGLERFRWIIGEVVVVFIGVLAALAIDQAWSDRQDRKLELELLKTLRMAVQGDIDFDNDHRHPRLKEKLDAIAAVAPVVRGFEPIPDDIELFLTNIGMAARGGIAPSVTFSEETFEDLMSSGKIRLITDPNIRNSIIRYYIIIRAEGQRLAARLTGYPEFILGIHPAELRGDLNLAAMESFNIDRTIDAIMSDQFETLFNREHNLALFMRSRQPFVTDISLSLLNDLDAHIEQLER